MPDNAFFEESWQDFNAEQIDRESAGWAHQSLAAVSDQDLIKRFQSTDGEGEEAEALLAEIQRRELDL